MTERPTDRPQDVGRDHRKRNVPPVESVALLERYAAAMRLELAGIIDELYPTSGQLTLVGDLDRPPLDRRVVLWALAVKLGRELAAAPASTLPPAVPGPRPAQPAPAFTVSQRRSLGQSGR